MDEPLPDLRLGSPVHFGNTGGQPCDRAVRSLRQGEVMMPALKCPHCGATRWTAVSLMQHIDKRPPPLKGRCCNCKPWAI